MTAPLRLLIVSDFYPPFIGGLERQSAAEALALASRGHDVHVATVWHPGLAETERDGGVEIHRLKGLFNRVSWLGSVRNRRYHPPFPDPLLVRQLRRLVRAIRPDAVNAGGWIAYSCAAAVKGLDVPLVVSARDQGYGCAVRTMVRFGAPCDGPGAVKCLRCAAGRYGTAKGVAAVVGVRGGRRYLSRRTSVFHCISRYVQMTLARDVLSADPGRSHEVALIPDIVAGGPNEPPEDVQAAAALPAGLPDQPYILFVGAIQQQKGVTALLDAYRMLPSPPPLVLVGTLWPDSPTRFPANVHVITDVPHGQVMTMWRHCLFGVAPSVTPEGFGDVVVECMASGRAVIGSTIGGHRDTIEPGKNGLAVAPGDVKALAEAMQVLIDDTEFRDRLGAQGLAKSRLYRQDAVAPAFEALFSAASSAAARR